jgi:hypothetical protein
VETLACQLGPRFAVTRPCSPQRVPIKRFGGDLPGTPGWESDDRKVSERLRERQQMGNGGMPCRQNKDQSSRVAPYQLLMSANTFT